MAGRTDRSNPPSIGTTADKNNKMAGPRKCIPKAH
jgi:hypothetical protein